MPLLRLLLPFNNDILDECNSIVVDPMDIEQIANAIKKLKDNSDLRKKLSEGALRKAVTLRIDKRAEAVKKFIESKK